MASIATLPNETLQQIFGLCWDEQLTVPQPTRSSGVERTLSHVSHRWRNVAIDTPRIWARIAIVWKGQNRPRARQRGRQVARVEAYLSRSRYYPLDILWRHSDSALKVGEERKDREFWEVVDKFKIHSARWKTLHIEADTQIAASSFVGRIYSTNASNLVIMNLDLSGIPGYTPLWHLYPAEQPQETLFPALRRLELGGWDLRRIPGPFSRVTTLVIVSTFFMMREFQEFTLMLELLPSLETLVMKRSSTNPLTALLQDPATVKFITLYRLRSLAFFAHPLKMDVTSFSLCTPISAPNLTSLHLVDQPLGQYITSVPNAPSFPKLRTLDLRLACYNMGDVDHYVGGVRSKQWINSLVTVTHLIIRSDIMYPLLLHPDLKLAFPSLDTITAFCNYEFRKHPKRCKVITFLRKLVEFRLENQPFDPSHLKLCLFKPCSRAGSESSRMDLQWMRENAEVQELDHYPAELLRLDMV